ncbi:granzyme B(G,H)-like [Anarrhichthys ocellatus]|uniref:granzyme B(G,H)-like n=1 Tax=Anarrhichthys ocellatus TaxID=433405 RepID=UPI0012ED3813|nr:granzyme B(G,H)-like [Anarrhichthys ocellatus]
MFIHCELLIAILVLTLDGRVHAGEIIGGHVAVPHSRPYMVLLYMYKDNGTLTHCGGFLLNEDFVMTAAHCKAESYEVLLGVHDVQNSNGKKRISVAQTFPHEDFNANDFRNDIMLLKLSSKAKFTKNVKPIALADKDDVSLPKPCLVSGWGRTKTQNISSLLMEVDVTLIDDEQCAEHNCYCSMGETGVGHGDSGGPLVCEDEKAYGVVSFAADPSDPRLGAPKVNCFMKIPYYRSWINSTMTKALMHVTIN